MKHITDTQFQHDIPTKYFQGRVMEIKKTQMGHLLITCDMVEEIDLVNGTKIIKKKLESSNFLLPKRRLGIYREAEAKIKYKQNFIFKLQEESRSKKFAVSEIFLPGDDNERVA